MLGKTNLGKVEKGAIISDIADYRWNNVKVDGVNESFIRVIYVNNVLVAITKRGTVAYTKDGENWETKNIELDNEDYFEFTDIAYGSGKYVIVGYHTDKETYMHGLIVTSEDLINYDVQTDAENADYFSAKADNVKFLGVSAADSDFTIFYLRTYHEYLGGSNTYAGVYAAIVNFKNKANINRISQIASGLQQGFSTINDIASDGIFKLARKIDGGTILYFRFRLVHEVYVSKDSISFELLTNDVSQSVSVFECKDSLYFSANTSDFNYDMKKVVGDSDEVILSTGIPYGFLDAAYFNKCEVFINSHEMLIVYPKEKISDKSLDDLVDITYDFSMTSIIKAFNKLYIFGTGGNILVSNDEADSAEALAVKTMSALKALYDAKAYTDKKCAEIAGVNLDDYVKVEDMQEIGDAEIEAIWNEVFGEDDGA